MDEWRDFYYSMNPGARNVEIGDLRSVSRPIWYISIIGLFLFEKRKELKKIFICQSAEESIKFIIFLFL